MFLKKFIYVNWGNIPASEFEFGPINLLSGGNGSGKTTAADAIQTIMTAAHDTLFNYNPGQDEATQRGRGKNVRTLASYVLGCDDGSYARPQGAVGYLAAVFHPTKNEPGEAFTAIIGVSASLDRAGSQPVARQNDIQFYVVAGEQLTLSDFLQENKQGQRLVVPLGKLRNWLQNRLGRDNAAGALNVEQYDTKKQYLRRLYGALRGRFDAVSEREAINAARTFSRFMAYKPVKSINGFVANEILEQRDLGDAIRSVSDLMKTIHAMESESRQLAATIERLNLASGASSRYIDQWLEHQVLGYTAAKSRFLEDQKGYLGAKEQQQNLRQQLKNAEQEREVAQQRRTSLREQLIGLEAKRLGISALQDKDAAEKSIEQCKQDLQRQALPLLEQDQLLQASLRASELIHNSMQKSSLALEIPSLASRGLSDQIKQVLAIKDQDSIDLRKLLGKDWIDLSPLEQHLDAARLQQGLMNSWRMRFHDAELESSGLSIREQISRVVDRREQRLQQLRARLEQKQADIDSLEARQMNYPGFVRQALEFIRRECPEADPRVLADYVSVTEGEWQSAIEGYIGGARFSIIVEPEFEAEAARILRAIPGGSKARVIQGEKARKDADRIRLPDNSIMDVLEFEHATARAYLHASYGSVEQVADAQALKSTRRGLTCDGLGSGSYSIYRCDIDDAELVFGAAARERAMLAKQNELQLLGVQANEAASSLKEASQLLDAINLLRQLDFGDQMQQMLDTHYQLQKSEKSLENIDLSDFSEVEHEFDQLKQKADEQDLRIRELDGLLGSLAQQLKDIELRCKQLSDHQEQTSELADKAEAALRQVASLWPDLDLEQALENADREASSNSADSLQKQAQAIVQELNSIAYEVERHIAEHNQSCQTIDAIVYSPDYRHEHSEVFFKTLCGLTREIERVHNRLKNNILVAKQDQLQKLRESFNNAFVTNLCHSIYQSINDGKRVLEELNRELAHHRFGADQECYWFDWEWVPEYKEYWQFFEEVIKNPTLGEGATLFDADLPKSALKVRDRLIAMLLDEDEQKAMRELERISDYRNYRSYEIYKQPANKDPIALSQYGTGSGGQLETPAYIIRSAAITSAFRFNEGDTHLRMVLVDEAFSKMDEARSKEVINYLTESLGLQLLFIMPTSKSGPFMDMISNQFVFSKIPLLGDQQTGELKTRVLVDRQKCNQERIQELWANHRKTIRHQAGLDFMAEFG
ncbi:ATP-binding protein [Oceanobacter mangrovi]|uniref:ATP-binding protein n=1 Tax=Oceanobacter mangrovi TaxID=2862510 RepID=UPI001C8EDC1C|nr:SbcC/MukB-like Walker B domain-containing protein [Oceanobacter mangrovi]